MTKPRKMDHPRYSDPRRDTGFPQGDRISAPYTNKIHNPEFWRLRADEVRSIADDMKLVEAKAIMTGIAEQYEGIAKLVEQLRDVCKRLTQTGRLEKRSGHSRVSNRCQPSIQLD